MADEADVAQEQIERAMLHFSHHLGIRPKRAACSHCEACGEVLESHRKEYCTCLECARRQEMMDAMRWPRR